MGGHLWAFVKVVWGRWSEAYYGPGGAFALWAYTEYAPPKWFKDMNRDIPDWVFLALAFVALFIAFFRAWRDQFVRAELAVNAAERARPKLRIETTGVVVGNFESDGARHGRAIFLMMHILNTGAPSVCRDFALRFFSNGREFKCTVAAIRGGDITLVGETGNMTISPSKFIPELTTTPIQSGGMVSGFVTALVEGIEQETLESFKVDVSCTDVEGVVVTATRDVTNVGPLDHRRYVQGMRT